MSRRLIAALPLLLGALALGHASAWPLALVLVVAIAAVTAAGPRWDVDIGRQWLSSAIGAGLGYVLVAFAYEPEPMRLGDGWAKLSAAALLAALARSLLIAPRGGHAVTLALGFAALSFAGKTTNPAYAAYAVPFVVSGVWALAGSAGPPAAAPPRGRRFWMGALVLGVAAAIGLGTTAGLRQLHAWAQGRMRHTSTAWQPRVGFSDRMDLGALDGLLDSDRRVLRVRGARVDYLRGAVLDLYERGRWIASDDAERTSKLQLGSSPAPAAVEISTVADRVDRFFLPLEAAKLAATPSAALVNDLGVVRPEAKRVPWSLRFAPGAREQALAPPRAADLHVPRRLRARITAIARDWTEPSMTEAEKLRAIEKHLLTEFGYSRRVDRSRRMDPLLDFLLIQRRGHCEYFASALALLGRAAGVPTRVVMGYRVSELSPFGHFVVRERNAHAWVEAWLPGVGWSTRDATPADAQPNNRPYEASYFASSRDALGVGYDELTDWLGRRTLTQTGLAWVGGCLVLALIVARGVRRRTRREAIADDAALLPFMLPLLEALGREGHTRRPDEPLERLAARLRDPEPAQLLHRYSALRYGGVGDRDALARDVRASVAARRRA